MAAETKPQKAHPNEGHRKRLRARFFNEGIDSMPPHNVLELLLFSCVARKDTNRIAHDLLDTFGSLQGVLDAPIEALMKVKDVGEQMAAHIKITGQISRYCAQQYFAPHIPFRCTADYVDCLEGLFIGRQEEVLVILYLNAAGKLLHRKQITLGGRKTLLVEERTILDGALHVNASHIVLAHNHPGGLALPSRDDTQMTKQLLQRLGGVGLTVVDHFIFAGDSFLSMRDMGYFD